MINIYLNFYSNFIVILVLNKKSLRIKIKSISSTKIKNVKNVKAC
jgi:hypothetical protein